MTSVLTGGEKDRPEVWIPEIPLSYYEFKREQQYAEDLDLSYATTDPEESSDDDILITKPHSKIKKVARIVHVESKRAKTVAKSVKTKLPTKRPAAEQPTKSVKTKPLTKRPAAEQPTKRPAAEPLGNVSNNVGGRPKRITKKPKKSLP